MSSPLLSSPLFGLETSLVLALAALVAVGLILWWEKYYNS